MPQETDKKISHYILKATELKSLLDILFQREYHVIAPSIRDKSIEYDPIASFDEITRGWIDHQKPGSYRLANDEQDRFFGYVVGFSSWKKYLYPADKKLFEAEMDTKNFRVIEDGTAAPKYAFLGVRSCDLKAIEILDKILTEGPYVDLDYKRARDNALIIVVNCTRAGENCFCYSMGTGPRAYSGFDLALTEISDGEKHYFLVDTGSRSGEELISELGLSSASEDEIKTAEKAIEQTIANMSKILNTDGLKEKIWANLDSLYWDEIAERCLNCGNCTLVCPTCFCADIEDTTDIAGEKANRTRKWDVCYTLNFTYVHGGSIRTSCKSRYRQWLTHKLSTWIDQFGMFGCVGCGRCITWCPVGIDIAEEAKQLIESS
ncbi:MAG: sulfite reductase subunit A [candidate division Zixibacteria bacterium]|nr:sulfite reductase subunit A [candidate division Zixibacteria bacterium]